ncbi:MAG: ABC transporter ATP-binding protein [Paracoccus hibiscisoli]|uniref:ABC transporter ATP-binding protein n=1 Tax=Paracoccus hibiscisoli TaxID=2023261 RepID=UPI003919B407
MTAFDEIRVENMVIDFPVGGGLFRRNHLRAANDVSLTLRAGEALAIVGESGSGKSTCARAISRILTPTSGRIMVGGQDILAPGFREGRRDYAARVQMIFQDPFGSLNPVHTIRHHIARPIRVHNPQLSPAQVEDRIIATLDRVGLAPAVQTAGKYPYELSGGQRQRVAIARALAVGARFILADEPISMLDVSIRLGILNLMDDMKRDGIGFMYITHDIATARYFAERTAVMYLGHMVEWGDSDSVTQSPRHPYTQLLISAVPQPGRPRAHARPVRKADIAQRGPDSRGCPFAGRCPDTTDQCRAVMPPVTKLEKDHHVRCHLY